MQVTFASRYGPAGVSAVKGALIREFDRTTLATVSASLELCYCQAARRNARFLSRLYDRHLAPEGISIQQFTILSVIDCQPGLLIADLAEKLVMERTSLVRALKPLRDAGWVCTQRAKGNRSLVLTVSRGGHRKVVAAQPLWNEAQHEFEMLYGTDKASQLRDGLHEASSLA
jgi:DNA-binding MarR family transcriptional regulator